MDVPEDDRMGELMVSKTTCRLEPWLKPPPPPPPPRCTVQPPFATTQLHPPLPTETVRTTAAFLGQTKTT